MDMFEQVRSAVTDKLKVLFWLAQAYTSATSRDLLDIPWQFLAMLLVSTMAMSTYIFGGGPSSNSCNRPKE